MKNQILAIANQKGGVGKTTTAINLASVLGLIPLRCLVVDVDPQGNATTGLGHVVAGEGGTFRMATGIEEPQQVITKTREAGVDLVSACSFLERLAEQGEASGIRALRSCLEQVETYYDLILLDCPPSAGGLTRMALAVADGVLIPTQSEPYALEGVQGILQVISNVQRDHKPELRVAGTVLTMFEPEQPFAWEMASHLRHRYGLKVWDTVIPRDSVVAKAAALGRSVIKTEPCSRAALSYIELAREILDHE